MPGKTMPLMRFFHGNFTIIACCAIIFKIVCLLCVGVRVRGAA